jgi:hypothetical protein
MGAWAAGSFDNDDASDWVWELEEANSIDPVLRAIESIENGGSYLQAPDCSIAIAAAEVVAAIFGKGSDNLPDSVADIAASLADSAPTTLKSRAGSAILRIKTESELRELWQESGALDEWTNELDDLLSRLQ